MPTEWRYAEILSCFNAYMDADALGLGAMANASFFQHYPLADRYPQNAKPTRERLIAQGVLDSQGRIVPRNYVAHYVGDYDAAAWLYRQLPRMWNDPARGTTPLSWAFNPNLCIRFPLGMAWARENRSEQDWFVAGDSGAGYLNPGNLSPPRPHSGLPSGWAAWERHCQHYYQQWDLSLTGFVIDGYARGLDSEGMDAFARFSPDGIVGQKVARQGVHASMPYIRMATDLQVRRPTWRVPSRDSFPARRRDSSCAAPFSRRQPGMPRWRRNSRSCGVRRFVLLICTRCCGSFVNTKRIAINMRIRRMRSAKEVTATPKQMDGVAVLDVSDGPVKTVEYAKRDCWQVAGSRAATLSVFSGGRVVLSAGFR